VDASEIVQGITFNLGIVLSKEESYLLAEYLDKDGNGLIDVDEFKAKINYREYQ